MDFDRFPYKEEVTGSNPVAPTRDFQKCILQKTHKRPTFCLILYNFFMRTQKFFDNSHFGYLFREWRKEHNINTEIIPNTDELKLFIKNIPSYELNEDDIHNWLLNLLTIENISVSSENGRKLAKQQFYLEKYGTSDSIEKYEELLYTVTKELKNTYLNISDKLFEIDSQIFDKKLQELTSQSMSRKEIEKQRKADLKRWKVEFEKKKASKLRDQKKRKVNQRKKRKQ